MQKHVLRYSIIFSVLFFATQAFAAGDTSNELLKVDLDQTSENAVKVNIYTDKPYKEKIIVNKKPNNKYVILLPETSNNTTANPDISGLTNIKDVDVKTQQYSSLPGKGYTKITIDSKTPIEVVPQAFVSKKATNQKRSTNRPYVSPQQVQMAVPQRVLNNQRPATTSDFVPAYERQRQSNQQFNLTPVPTALPAIPVPQQQYNTLRQVTPQTARTYQQPQSVAQTVTNTSANTQSQTQPQAQTTVTSQPEQQVTQDDTQQTTQTAQETVTEKNNKAIDDASSGQIEDDLTDDDLEIFKKIIRFKQKVVRKIKQLLSARITLSSVMTVLQLILLVVLVKIIGDLVKKLQNNENQPTTFTRRLIHDNSESFEQAYPSYSNMDVYNNNRDTFEEDGKEGFNITPLSAPENFTNKPQNQQNLYSNGLNNYSQPKAYSAQNDFYKPLSKMNEEDKMSIFDESAKDIEKTIFRNPLKSISKQEEDKLFDEEEPAKENTPFADNKYDNKEVDFFNYTGSEADDEDFFIFEDEENDENIEYQEDYIDEEEYDENDEDDEYEYEYEYEDNNEENENEEDVENFNEYTAETAEEEQATQNVPQEEVNPFEHLIVYSKYVIDSNRGFAQVSVDGINALIGYVGSKISVLRKFKDEELKGNMQVRMNEQPDPETMIYIVKVGSYKTLVEVKPQSIRQLLDL